MDLQRFYAGACFGRLPLPGRPHGGRGRGVPHLCPQRGRGVSAGGVGRIGRSAPWSGCWTGISGRRTAQGAVPGQRYKYRIWKRDGSFLDHCDPYGFWMEKRPHTASVLCGPEQDYIFSDQAWMAARTTCQDRPLHIYEVHAALGKSRGPGLRIGTIGTSWGSCCCPTSRSWAAITSSSSP